MFRPKVYVALKMSYRYQDELVMEAEKMCRILRNYGFDPLHPVITENVEPIHEILVTDKKETLEKHWRRDKKDIQDAHIILDDRSCNKSDGVGVELGLSRFCYYKPVVRIFPDAGICISALEYDHIFDNAIDAVIFMNIHYGTRWKLLKWRLTMLGRSLPKWIWLQTKFIGDIVCG